MTNSPKVSILTLNWNGLEHLKYFIPSVSEIDYDNFEIIVIDNGSTDASIKFMKREYPSLKLLPLKKNRGYARGFNIGIKYACKMVQIIY